MQAAALTFARVTHIQRQNVELHRELVDLKGQVILVRLVFVSWGPNMLTSYVSRFVTGPMHNLLPHIHIPSPFHSTSRLRVSVSFESLPHVHTTHPYCDSTILDDPSD